MTFTIVGCGKKDTSGNHLSNDSNSNKTNETRNNNTSSDNIIIDDDEIIDFDDEYNTPMEE